MTQLNKDKLDLGGNDMKKRSAIILLFALLLTSLFLTVQGGSHPSITSEDILPKGITLRNEQIAAAVVNGIEIPLKEYERFLINADISYKYNSANLLESRNSGRIGNEEYEERMAYINEFHNDPLRNQKILKKMIQDELLYQAAKAKGYVYTEEEARLYEAKAPEMLTPEQLQFLTDYAKSLSMTYEEYAEAYLIPMRVKKMTAAQFLAEYKDASLEEYQQMINSLFEKASIQIIVEIP